MQDGDTSASDVAVRNAQTKLTATWLNGISIALFAIGALTPFFSSIYSSGTLGLLVSMGIAVCFSAATGLHLLARQTLRGLKP
ncbi:amino acid transporter [Brucella sp. IR073]|uniref:amino acid transporter n=1 Tax=unclassified Brucella TaxID=2632610 RepID=UPI003B9871B0